MIEIQTFNNLQRGKQKLLLISIFATVATVLGHYLAASILLIFILITGAEVIFFKRETFITRKIESMVVHIFLLFARVLISTIYVLLIMPMSFIGSKRIDSALSASISMEDDPGSEGCLCELDLEVGY